MKPALIIILWLGLMGLFVDCSNRNVDKEMERDSATGTDTVSDGTIWHPVPGTTWQWQLSGQLDTSLDVQMYDIDLMEQSAETIAALHAQGKKVICYFSAGSYENWRPDVSQWNPATDAWIGSQLEGWPNEYWLDVSAEVVRNLMLARLDMAVTKECDGVEPDNVDGYTNNNGVGLTAQKQLDYNIFLAEAAHARGLSIGLKNDLNQVIQLEPYFDWALNEECLQWNECTKLAPFIDADKAVFHVEYNGNISSICAHSSTQGFSSMKKNYNLDAWVEYCP